MPDNIPQYLKKAITLFNQLLTDIRGLSIVWENKINALQALFIALQRVNIQISDKLKNKGKNPQTAKQLKLRREICKKMKKALRNVKTREDLLTDSEKSLLPRSSDIDPLGMNDVDELNNPFFKKPPAKADHIPNLLSKDKKKKTHTITSATTAAAATTTTTTERCTETEDRSSTSTKTKRIHHSSSTSTKTKRTHPWFIKIRMKNENTSEEKCSKKDLTYGMKMTKENAHIGEEKTESSEQNSSPNLTDGMKMTEHADIREEKTESSEQKSSRKKNVKYTQRRTSNISKKKGAVSSIDEYDEAYPWAKEAARNRLKQSPLAPNISKINEYANKILSTEMKNQLYEYIKYPEVVIEKISKNIGQEGDKFVCIKCKNRKRQFSHARKFVVIHHLIAELGFFQIKCSFCDTKSNDSRTIVKHYALEHGVPSSWIKPI